MKMIEMIKGAKKLVEDHTRVKEGENVLILTDTNTSLNIAQVLAIACKERGAEPIIIIMSASQLDHKEPPPPVGEAMQKAQVIFMICSRSLMHSSSRIRASKAGARFFSFSEVQEEDLYKGAIEANIFEAKEMMDKMADVLANAKKARISTQAGTDLYLDLTERPEKILKQNSMCHQPGESKGILLEVAISPRVGSANGKLVCDACVTLFKPGLIKEPIYLTIKDGRISEINGGTEARRLSALMSEMDDPLIYNVAELGMGFNPKAKLTGSKTQDKGVYGTCHIGFGSNTSWGGKIKAATHFDLIIYSPKIELDGVTVLENCKFKI